MTPPPGFRSNIEIKAPYAVLAHGHEVARRLGAEDGGLRRQRDHYYRVPRGRLKLREIEGRDAELIFYLRRNNDGPRRSDYQVLPVDDPDHLRALLEEMLGPEVVVDKQRQLYLVRQTRIHLDEVRHLGTFIEFESVFAGGDPVAERAARAHVDELLREFDVARGRLIPGSYRELLLERQAR